MEHFRYHPEELFSEQLSEQMITSSGTGEEKLLRAMSGQSIGSDDDGASR